MNTAPDAIPPDIGGRIGSRLGKVVADATIDTRRRMAGYQSQVAQKVLADFTNHVSDEIRGAMGPVWRQVALHPDTPPDIARLFAKLGGERGQAWAWIAGAGLSAGMAGGIGNLLTNVLNPVILPMIRAAPHGVLDAATAASVARSGLGRGFSPLLDSRSNAIDDDRFRALVELGRPLPTLAEVWALVNKGSITADAAFDILGLYGYAPKYRADLLSLRMAELSAPEIAAMWNRGIISTSEGNRLGRHVGMTAQQMGQLYELGGEPPPNQELLMAWRRGIITEAQVNRALRQSPLRFEWMDVIKSLQWAPLTVNEAADAVNQGHMSLAAATKVARENGVRPADFEVIVDNAGRPPGPQEALDWANRGLITRNEFSAIFKESTLKNKYIDLYWDTRHETMPPETIRLMYSRGALTQAQASRRLQQRGYSAEDAAIILDGASAEKTQASRDLTVAQIRDLYADRLISRSAALAMFDAMGYETDESLWILELAELARTRRFVTAAVNRVKSGYVKGLLSETDAQTQLDRLGIPADAKQDMLELWDIEFDSVTRDLTPAQIVSAVKKDFLGAEAGMRRLVGQGYGPQDALILLRLGGAVE